MTTKDKGPLDDISFTPPGTSGTGGHEPRPAGTPAGSGERIYGVFSTEVENTVGTGTTRRKESKRAIWFAEQTDSEEGGEPVIEVQPINNKNVPSGRKKTVPLGEFLRDYSPELEFYHNQVFPKMKELDSVLEKAEDHREKGAYYSAQFGFEAALEFDERNVRANFGLGLTYMDRGDRDKAADMFRQVVALDAAFSPEHKHLFNEFGISLRKSGLFDQAVEYYARALEITANDENLYYNMARAHFERGDKDQCRENLEMALSLKPDFEEAAEFMAHLKKQAPTQVLPLD